MGISQIQILNLWADIFDMNVAAQVPGWEIFLRTYNELIAVFYDCL